MRKDFIELQGSSVDEAVFVEDHWTKVWEQEGGPQGRIEKVARQDEYGVMRDYLGAFVGCGVWFGGLDFVFGARRVRDYGVGY
jgi:hypothetical protein